jgi:hypothetical protein
MSFKTDEVIAFAKSKELPARVVASIEARASCCIQLRTPVV